MSSDLQELVKALGEDSDKWLGRLVSVRGKKDGDYWRWVIVPFVEK